VDWASEYLRRVRTVVETGEPEKNPMPIRPELRKF
jgi:hypothetical protein